MKFKGNKGEWSELYAFVKLLSTGKLYAADKDVQRINNIFFPILKILRSEETGSNTEYIIHSSDGSVDIHWHTEAIRNIPQHTLKRMAAYLYQSITLGNNRSFEIEGSEEIMDMLSCSKISAPSTDKTDITMQIHDIHTGYSPICGFSIKSELGSAPTLLNASGATIFIFEVGNISDEQMEHINSISTNKKILDRINMLTEIGTLKFSKAKNSIFSGNLMLIDTYMEYIISELLLDFYLGNGQTCSDLVSRLEARNPLNYPRKGLYEYKFKKFLCSIALGMMPSKIWNGLDEANGGYIIVKEDGDVVAYHIYNRDAFEAYLLENTKFERGSTSKHDFASIYKDSTDQKFINLNLQSRFK